MNERLKAAIPWSDDIRWQPTLTIQAKTYNPLQIWDDIEPAKVRIAPKIRIENGEQDFKLSPCRKWIYVNQILPRGAKLECAYGSRVGDVAFDGPVLIPTLYEVDRTYSNPWMSLTPQEIISLRAGERFAKGHTVIAGLGLGWQLLRVARRPQVKRITLVEIDQGLVNWILPRLLKIEPLLKSKLAHPRSVIVGDAFKEVPKLEADVALIDIFEGFGGNKYDTDRIREFSFGIKKVWGWATQPIQERYFAEERLRALMARFG